MLKKLMTNYFNVILWHMCITWQCIEI